MLFTENSAKFCISYQEMTLTSVKLCQDLDFTVHKWCDYCSDICFMWFHVCIFTSECDIQSKVFWWLIPPLTVDKMTFYILVMHFFVVTNEAVHTGLVYMLKTVFR